MHLRPDPMSHEFAHYRKAMAFGEALEEVEASDARGLILTGTGLKASTLVADLTQ